MTGGDFKCNVISISNQKLNLVELDLDMVLFLLRESRKFGPSTNISEQLTSFGEREET